MVFNPGMGGGSMSKMLKQAKQMQEQLSKLQEELEQREIESSSGGGAITLKITGKQQITALKINPDAVDAEDIEMLEDMIMAAVNEGIRKSQEMVSSEMAKITNGMKIPGL
ncbi:MAG TPA: YbaB/EbfC family nucleoid-associated protein [Syntrophomonadaceae bacterium]|nr:YbaB/EbfC family nucleoid-associated protein [Syntrophomonadaceae bacterium]HNX29880.1 YbaB/EbfC family nucleoid-associated protein [Syntrophomonadaceae bacterium]HPR93941.1 YbaB/EbfC family nucleoid-associated protein [Syntrophomonadaceae bacterium]